MFAITEEATTHVRELIEKNKSKAENLRLKLVVENAGCAGTKYGIQLTNVLNRRDVVHKRGGIEIIIPEDYYGYFEDATVAIDEKKRFKIEINQKRKAERTI